MNIHIQATASPAVLAALIGGDDPTLPPLRMRIEREIEAMIDLLDSVDGDPDLEDGGDDEPSLAMPEAVAFDGRWWRHSGDSDRPIRLGSTDDREGPDDDAEPDLGAPEIVRCMTGPMGWPSWGRTSERSDQTLWARGQDLDDDDVDREEDDPAEECGDDEPSLGSLGGTAATGARFTDFPEWAGGTVEDYEIDVADEGEPGEGA